MAEVMLQYKISLLRCGKKIKDLAQELGMSYSQVSRIINGFDNPPIMFDNKVSKILKKWEPLNEGKNDK